MKEMIEELVAEVKVEPGKWEEVVQEVACGLARQVAVALLKRLDDGLMEEGVERLRGLGTIESNIDKLVASRMKKRGMSRTKPGGDRMARLINLRERGELHLWVNSVHQQEVCEKTGPSFKLRSESDKPSEDKYRVWLEAGVPALYGPYHNHPWAQALAAIAHETESITRLLSGIAPTRS